MSVLVYAPEGATTPKAWPFKPNQMPIDEIEEMERSTGLYFAEWVDALENGSMVVARRFLLVMLRRDDPQLKLDAVRFSPSDLAWELDDDERRAYVELVDARVKAGDATVTEAMRAQADAWRPDVTATTPAGDGEAGGQDPKDEAETPG